MKTYVCSVCGYSHEGDDAPESCPQCGAVKSKFSVQEGDLVGADAHTIGVAQGVDPEIVQGLKDNFMGECTEVGMYLAMSRQADREGYPEVAEAYKRIAFEEAEHAAKFADADSKKADPIGGCSSANQQTLSAKMAVSKQLTVDKTSISFTALLD